MRATGAAHARGYTPELVVQSPAGDPQIVKVLKHPKQFTLVYADSEIRFTHLRWRHWGKPKTTAKGWARTCGGGGIDGYVCHRHRVRIVADRLSVCTVNTKNYRHAVAHGVPDFGSGPLALPTSMGACGF